MPSFEGKEVNVKLSQKLFSKTLTVSCLSDTLRFSDCRGVIKVQTLNKNFLKILYGLRGGTGLDVRNTLILSVIDNKIKVSMLVQSYVGALIENRESVYELQLKLTGNRKNDYRMIVKIYGDRKLSSGFIEKNISKQIPLKFDLNRNFFIAVMNI